MDAFYILFPVSGVKTWVFLPPIVAFVVSTLTSMAGVSGAFILLPFQMSVLGFTSPAVSSTNFVYNIVAIPSGVYRYFKEGRMAWPLTWVVIIGTLPGVFIGYYPSGSSTSRTRVRSSSLSASCFSTSGAGFCMRSPGKLRRARLN